MKSDIDSDRGKKKVCDHNKSSYDSTFQEDPNKNSAVWATKSFIPTWTLTVSTRKHTHDIIQWAEIHVSFITLSSRPVGTASTDHTAVLSHDLSLGWSDHTSPPPLLGSNVNREQAVLRSGWFIGPLLLLYCQGPCTGVGTEDNGQGPRPRSLQLFPKFHWDDCLKHQYFTMINSISRTVGRWPQDPWAKCDPPSFFFYFDLAHD